LTTPSRLSLTAYIYGRTGDKVRANQYIQQLRKDDKAAPAYYVAIAYAGLDEGDAAIEALEKSVRERDGRLVNLKVHPAFDRLRALPGFRTILQQMNLAS
jgi:hypothetical protein